jgi:hypothetical protein
MSVHNHLSLGFWVVSLYQSQCLEIKFSTVFKDVKFPSLASLPTQGLDAIYFALPRWTQINRKDEFMSHSKRPVPVDEDSADGKIRERLHETKEIFETGGVELPGVGGFLYIWRKLGLKGALLAMLLVGFPIGRHSLLRSAVYSGIPHMVGGFGLEFKADEWSLALFNLDATARNVEMRVPSDEKPVFTAGEIEFHGSPWTFLRGLPDLLTFHFFGWHQAFNEIVIKHGELHLERSLTGRLNWDDFVAAVPQERIQEAVDGVYQIHALRLEDLRISYIEHIPGGSGDGVIKTAEAQVKVDEVRGTIANLSQPSQSGERPTSFKVNGRSADGVFEISGNAALFRSKDAPDSKPDYGLKTASFDRSASSAGDYPFELSVYLENISAGAYGRMVPVTTIIPVKGLIGGTVKVVRTGAKTECAGSLMMKDVSFAPNPLMLPKASDIEVVRRGLVNVAYSGVFDLCDGTNSEPAPKGPGVPPASLALARLTEQATSQAPPGVKALVARDRMMLGGQKPATTVNQLTSALAQQLSGRIARALPANLANAAANLAGNATGNGTSNDDATRTDNTVTKGFKSIGSGIKRLFGRKK